LNQVLTDKVWRDVAKRARSARGRKAAIASPRAIRSGQTDAKLLRRLLGAGVVINSREGLHSKVAPFGKHAIVGSANMSGSDLIEAAVMTDSPVIVSGVAAFIEKLSTARTKLSAREIEKLCAIEVIRTGRLTGGRRTSNPVRRLGNATWILGVKEMKEDPTEGQQKRIDRRTRELNERLGTEEDDFAWIRWGKKSRFGRECRAGDTLIRIYNSRNRKRPVVTRRVRVLLKDPEPNLNRFYTEGPAGRSNEVSWSRFQRILKEAGFPRGMKPMSALKLDPRWPRSSTVNGRGFDRRYRIRSGIAFRAIDDVVDVVHVPDDPDLRVFRLQPAGIDADDPVDRKLVVVRRPHVGFEDVVRPTAQYDRRAGHAWTGGGIDQIVAGREAYQIRFGRDAAALPDWKRRRLRSKGIARDEDVHPDHDRQFAGSHLVDREQGDRGLQAFVVQRQRDDVDGTTFVCRMDEPKGPVVLVADRDVDRFALVLPDADQEVTSEIVRPAAPFQEMLFGEEVERRRHVPVGDKVIPIAPLPDEAGRLRQL
jgi:hypothetical protein